MKKPNFKSYLTGFLFICLFMLEGCATPSIHEAISVLQTIPFGETHNEVKKAVLGIYPKNTPPNYIFVSKPRLLTDEIIQADKNIIEISKQENLFTYVYPSDLYEKMSSKGFYDGIGVFAEGSGDRDCSITIYYDIKTNYIGFFANDQLPVR